MEVSFCYKNSLYCFYLLKWIPSVFPLMLSVNGCHGYGITIIKKYVMVMGTCCVNSFICFSVDRLQELNFHLEKRTVCHSLLHLRPNQSFPLIQNTTMLLFRPLYNPLLLVSGAISMASSIFFSFDLERFLSVSVYFFSIQT